MSEYYQIVLWFDTAEWLSVYDLIFSSNSTFETKEEALKRMLVWKARRPSLLSGIESTIILLEVYIRDSKLFENALNDQSLRLAYSTAIRLAYSSAIMRFAYYMLDTEIAQQAAKLFGLPDWIIYMRYDSTLNSNLLSIEVLRDACSISLDWLQKFYWDKHRMCINDYVVGQKEINVNDERRIGVLIEYCISLNICAHSRSKLKSLSEIPDATTRETIVNKVRDLFEDNIALPNLKTVPIKGLVKAITLQLEKLLCSINVNKVAYVNKALLGEDSLFLSMELLNANELYNKNQLNKTYMRCFEFMLTFLHSNDLLLEFLMELINISENTNSDKYRSRLSALWVSEILIALRKCKHFIDRMNKINKCDFDGKKKKDLKLMFHNWFPDESVHGLFLDLYKPVPQELMNMNFITPIISRNNSNLTYFVRDLLNLVEPRLLTAEINEICLLAKKVSVCSEIYSVDELIRAIETSPGDESD